MKSDLPPGTAATFTITVDRQRTIDFLGEDLRVYATPELLRDYEYSCRDVLLPYCDPGEDSVGTGITMTHGGVTLLGMQVQITARVLEVNGRAVKFGVSAHNGVEEISTGEHTRFVVDIGKLKSRVAATAAKHKAT